MLSVGAKLLYWGHFFSCSPYGLWWICFSSEKKHMEDGSLKSSWLRETARMYVVYMTFGVATLPFAILSFFWREHAFPLSICGFAVAALSWWIARGRLILPASAANGQTAELNEPQGAVNTAVVFVPPEWPSNSAVGSRLLIENIYPPHHPA